MSFFAKTVDRRSRKAMTAFLMDHFRYDTMNSWNRSTSYAHCVKVHRIGLSREQQDAAFKLLGAEGAMDEVDLAIHSFTNSMNGAYTIGFNGRSSGYLVLYHSRYTSSEHKSRCLSCGQLNFKRVAAPLADAEKVMAEEMIRSGFFFEVNQGYLRLPAINAIDLPDADKLAMIAKLKPGLKDATIGNKCGRCGAEGERGRVNITPPRQLDTWPGRDIDQGEDFSEWSMEQLRSRVDLVCAFDRACDEIRDVFIGMLTEYEPVEKTVMVPKTVTVLERRAQS
ncbi:cysteine protease (plasmid) [Burkholderia sp. KK1]|uniref:Uncharacterized protein n=1 Tax=Burkholderia sp. M701 TaxID=326454 RepID=V5YPI2_9BURK|nr:hypothetical protein [Burkholderia sp. M701]AQH05954.1 cysteine protease [Burkholderia sp. KK1]BAO19184.1 hypothetical protein [Burkholderia sp. M701]